MIRDTLFVPDKSKSDYLDAAGKHPAGPRFYECGICGSYHYNYWNGDCREDAARFDVEELDERFGVDGWEEVPMSEDEEDES